tara:strand:+ start:557 stop:853 length:297 start_codon:yes stop_codon:yes gene_type:complete
MAQVQFDEVKFDSNTSYKPKHSFFVRMMMGTGLVKTPGQAQVVLFVLSLIILFFSVRYLYSLDSEAQADIIYREDLPSSVRSTLPQTILETYPSKLVQ